MTTTGPRLLVFGGWDEGAGYPRAAQLIAAFAADGWSVVRCRVAAPYAGAAKRQLAAAPWRWPLAAVRIAAAAAAGRRLLRRAVRRHRPDLVLVPYPAHGWVGAARSAFAGPVVADLFMSAHDTVVEDRRLVRAGGAAAWLLRRADRAACARADLVLLDTPTHAARLAELTGLPATRFGWVAVGPVVEPPAPAPLVLAAGEPMRLLYFGTGVPLHGLDVLVAAVGRAAGRVRLTLVGGGAACRRALVRAPVAGVALGPEFAGPAELAALVASHHAVAGVFGTSRKAELVVPYKVVQGLAACRAVVTADTPAVRALLRPDVELWTTPPGDSAALAARLAALADSGRIGAVAEAGHRAYLTRFAAAARQRQLHDALEPVLAARALRPSHA